MESQQQQQNTSGNAEERLILASLGVAWCGAAIARHEAASGQRFDLVAYARPDVLTRAPVVPWCEWEWSRGVAAVCGASGADGLWVVPRNLAPSIFERAALHSNCSGEGIKYRKIASSPRIGGGATAHASCCGGAEALLTSALLRAAKRVDPRSCAKLSWADQTFLRQVQRQPETQRPCKEMLKPVVCLHRRRHVCDAALNERYVPGGYWSRIQSYHNSLTMHTGKLLRELFLGNASACRDAMSVVR